MSGECFDSQSTDLDYDSNDEEFKNSKSFTDEQLDQQYK